MVWLNLISKTPWFLCKVQFAEVMCDTMKKNEKSTLLLVLLKYSVKSTLHSHSVVISKLFPHDFLAKIPSKYYFTKELSYTTYTLISRKYFEVVVNFRNFHTVLSPFFDKKNRESTVSTKGITKRVDFTKFFQ